ncbi:NUDIX domain-containing protein [Reyranella sp. CPCC 100927]|uniref:NUDIX domain-containing protein n=1 Tax=Reyranella sp. CPCC 100927 TaxID=2599616 RepID=UPI0011B707AB|nr:NUDIX domain-containing protein [Reyranella sp. CPCC 100927]TWS93655.1 NUDIX domain-containing protein [Reyranella sp. CPCC 100927]
MSLANRVRIHDVKTLSDDWYVLKKTTFDFQRRDGVWQRQSRETYDRGDGATILLYSRAQRSVILVRQFRFPAYVTGWDDLLTETPAGLLDRATPADAIRREVEEETGYRVRNVQPVFRAYMSPGSVTERLYFFVAEYEPQDRVTSGGGDEDEGEDIEVVELPIEDALRRIDTGEICDGKTIMLLQYAALRLFAEDVPAVEPSP